MKTLGSIPLEHIRAAEKRIAGDVLRSPLIRLNVTNAPAEIFLKLENLQPIGSFKLRGTANAILSASDKELERGVWTSSAGNMAQGLAWYARQLWLLCSVVVPENAPDT